MQCPCKPDFIFKTKNTLNTHLKSDGHKLYQLEQDLIVAKNRINQLEMEALHKNMVEKTLITAIGSYEHWIKNISQQ